MNQKELKTLAKKIAKAELVIQHSDDPEAIAKAQNEILELSGKAKTFEDIFAIDEMVQEILENS